jgi:hypothetical protein
LIKTEFQHRPIVYFMTASVCAVYGCVYVYVCANYSCVRMCAVYSCVYVYVRANYTCVCVRDCVCVCAVYDCVYSMCRLVLRVSACVCGVQFLCVSGRYTTYNTLYTQYNIIQW